MKVHEASLSRDLQGPILKPAEPTGWGVVVLAGSSGRVDVARARLFAGLGAVCIALRYFGGERQPPGICEVPLEVFTRATDRLIEEGCERVAYVGTSKGAEAALLIATDDPRVRVVAATSPSSVVWVNIGPGIDGVAWPQRSSWTRGGVPLPFIKYNETWRPERREGLVTYRSRQFVRRDDSGRESSSGNYPCCGWRRRAVAVGHVRRINRGTARIGASRAF
jgi:hypothetical protein